MTIEEIEKLSDQEEQEFALLLKLQESNAPQEQINKQREIHKKLADQFKEVIFQAAMAKHEELQRRLAPMEQVLKEAKELLKKYGVEV